MPDSLEEKTTDTADENLLTDEEKKWLVASVTCDEKILGSMLSANRQLANWQNYIDGNTALHFAAKFGECAIIRLLVGDFKADVNIRNFAGLTPLHLAAVCAQTDAVELLTSTYGANPTLRDYNGQYPRAYLPKNKVKGDLTRMLKHPKETVKNEAANEIFALLEVRESQADGHLRSPTTQGHRNTEPVIMQPYFPWQQSGESPPQKDSLKVKEKRKSTILPESELTQRRPTRMLAKQSASASFTLENVYSFVRGKRERAWNKFTPQSATSIEDVTTWQSDQLSNSASVSSASIRSADLGDGESPDRTPVGASPSTPDLDVH